MCTVKNSELIRAMRLSSADMTDDSLAALRLPPPGVSLLEEEDYLLSSSTGSFWGVLVVVINAKVS